MHLHPKPAAIILSLMTSCLFGSSAGFAADTMQRSGGTISVPAFEIPFSRYLSEEAKKAMIQARAKARANPPKIGEMTIADVRKYDSGPSAVLDRIRERYPVDITEQKIAGVRTRVIVPKNGVSPRNRNRVLLNVHGGGFFMGAENEALIESIPIASVAGAKVITIDYREGPEHKFPAATQDVIAVYREIIKQTKASGIGIYGCSAGGILTGMVAAALEADHLPRPGAIGIFSSGAYGNWGGDPLKKGTWGGDSRYWAGPIGGEPGLSVPNFVEQRPEFMRSYLSEVDIADPRVSPAESIEILGKFPPTLFIAGTRAYDMSAVVQTHRQLTKANVEADLHIWDGLGHCFFFDSDLPESREAYSVIAKFFDKHLGSRKQAD